MKFRSVLNKEVEVNYHKWLGFATNITHEKPAAYDLLHFVIAKTYDCTRIQDKEGIEPYIIGSMKKAWVHRNSSFWREQHTLRATEIEGIEPTPPDQSNRILNENVDVLISRLPEIEAELMRLYALDEFSYEEIALATGVPITYLYGRIASAKNKLRRYVDIR